MTRHELREQTFRMLFGAGFHEEAEREASLDCYMDETCEFEVKDEKKQAIIARVMEIDRLIPELDHEIDEVAAGWTTRRMGRAELNILRLALYEMRYDDTVPLKVAINEAVELAKEYGADEAPAFINGILAKLAAKLPQEETEESEAPQV